MKRKCLTLEVGLGRRSYRIEIAPGVLEKIGRIAADLGLGTKCAIVSDETVFDIYGSEVRQSLESAGFEPAPIVLPPGESTKSMAFLEQIYDRMIEHRLDRKSFIVALGGGVVGDIAGFAAATYMRGIPFMQAPTTLLAQVDSSVGGKVAVNLPQGKNLIGAFYQPAAVVIDPRVLKTLDQREMKAGFVEVAKHGMIKDPAFFDFMDENAENILACDLPTLSHAIHTSCKIKSEVVEQDERESGLRAILNFGHTAGHALEMLTGYSRYLHGEAVAVGMVAAIEISDRYFHRETDPKGRIVGLLKACDLPTAMPDLPPQDILQAMIMDKKNIEGKLKMVLLREIGTVEIVDDLSQKLVIEALEKLQQESP